MARYSISGRSTIVPTAARPGVSLFGVSTMEAKIREVQIYNTAATAFVASLQRLTNATGQGTGLTEVPFDGITPALCTGFAGHTADPGLGAEIMRADLGAAIGAGVIWTFDAEPIRIAAATTSGLGVMCPQGTGQTFDYTIIWDE